ncbi:hypothetical protein [Streptacidiphilus sp. PAMC 29251]
MDPGYAHWLRQVRKSMGLPKAEKVLRGVGFSDCPSLNVLLALGLIQA